MALNINKQGQFLENNLNEYHVEPDGSIWEHIFHHNSPSENLFSSTDNFDNGLYKSNDLWFNFQICNQLSSWEILVVQTAERYNNPIKLRWVQNQSPLSTTFANVASRQIVKNTSTGYTNFSEGGLVRGNKSSNTYLTVNDGKSGDWWGATGSFTAYQGGIPGFNHIIVKSGCIDIFIRVDDIAKNAKFYKNGLQVCNNFYEY